MMAPRRTRQISIKDCYEILNLQKGASLQDLKTAYRRRAFELHPDLNPGNPEAGRQFQLLNEAYVALSAILKPKEESQEKEQGAERSSQKETGQQNRTEQKTAEEKESSRASAAYAEQDVLRDLLNDPFARRVFEDIYSELNRKQEPKADFHQPPPQKERVERPPVREPKKPAPAQSPQKTSQKGMTKVLKDWLLDDEQSLTMPAARLRPGARIRLQIRKGLSEDVTPIEVTLPADFVVGKPMRLRGLGKKVGRWQGDLYLTIFTE